MSVVKRAEAGGSSTGRSLATASDGKSHELVGSETLNSRRKEVTLCGEQYELVPKTCGVEESDVVKSIPPALAVLPLRRAPGFSRVKARGMKPVRTWLCQRVSAVSSANTPLDAVVPLEASNASGYSSFAAVYDVGRVHRVKIGVYMYDTNPSENTAQMGIVCFDPSNVGVMTSVADAFEHAYHGKIQKIGVVTSITTSTNSSMPISGQDCLDWFEAKCERVIEAPAASSSELVGSNWFDTSVSTNVCGYLKPYIEAAGGSVTSRYIAFVLYDCEFKYRG